MRLAKRRNREVDLEDLVAAWARVEVLAQVEQPVRGVVVAQLKDKTV
jgi:hypothetical protein